LITVRGLPDAKSMNTDCSLSLALATLLAMASSAAWPAAPGKPAAVECKAPRYTPPCAQKMGTDAVADVTNANFARVDRTFAALVEKMPRATDGRFAIEAFQRSFKNRLRNRSDGDIDAWWASWEKGAPLSKARAAIEPVMWTERAWFARGSSYGWRVPGESAQVFRERLARAADSLQRSESFGKESPIWYWTALNVAGGSGRPAAQVDALFDEAVTRFPYYQPIYSARMHYLLPQWGGSVEAIDRFILAAVRRTAPVDGEAFYAWLYMVVAENYGRDLFTSSKASWPRMKRSFEDMIQRYPDLLNRNYFAAYACMVRDKATTARLLAELGANANLDRVMGGINTESCRRFAFSPA
jgi:hypothetical protein